MNSGVDGIWLPHAQNILIVCLPLWGSSWGSSGLSYVPDSPIYAIPNLTILLSLVFGMAHSLDIMWNLYFISTIDLPYSL